MNRKTDPKNLIRKSGIIRVWTCFLVMILIGTITGNSYGWFSNNTDAKAKGARIQIKEDKSINISRLIVYKYKIEDNRMFAAIDDPTSPSYMILNQYDTVFPERQTYTPMILKIPLELTLGEDFYISFVCSGDLLDNNNKLAKNLSNVIKVRCASNAELDKRYPTDSTEGEIVTTEFYDEAKEFFENDKFENTEPYITTNKWREGKFVTYDKLPSGGITNLEKQKFGEYKGLIQFRATNCNQVTYDGVQQVNLYMYIDYDSNLIDEYIKGSEFSFDKGNVCEFEKDIVKITFSKTSDIPE